MAQPAVFLILDGHWKTSILIISIFRPTVTIQKLPKTFFMAVKVKQNVNPELLLEDPVETTTTKKQISENGAECSGNSSSEAKS